MGKKLYLFQQKEIINEIIKKYLSGIPSTNLGKEYGVHYLTILRLLRKNGIRVRTNAEVKGKYKVWEDAFAEVKDEQDSYWYGFIGSDGYISEHKRRRHLAINLGEKDLSHLEKFKNYIQTDAPIRIISKKGRNYPLLKISNVNIVNNLLKLGLHQNKSLTLQAPLNLKEELECAYVRGAIDGDGCIHMSRLKCNNKMSYNLIMMGTPMILKWIGEVICKNLGIVQPAIRPVSKGNCSIIGYYAKGDFLKILNWLYKDATIYLERKRNKAVEILASEGINI